MCLHTSLTLLTASWCTERELVRVTLLPLAPDRKKNGKTLKKYYFICLYLILSLKIT